MLLPNPAGTDGFDFLEFTTLEPEVLAKQFLTMGFTLVAKHRECNVMLYQQNDIRFFINSMPNSKASEFASLHGPSVSAMGFRVKDAKAAYEHALSLGARLYQCGFEKDVYHLPAIYGVGDSLIYFVDHQNGSTNYAKQFEYLSQIDYSS